MTTQQPSIQQRQNPLTSQPIPILIRRIGVPVGTGAFFNTMFNVVDTYYAGLISKEALASLSLSFPIFFIIVALGFGLSSGNTALIGNALGRGERDEADRFAVQGIVFGAGLAVVVTFIGILIAPYLFGLLGASEAYLAMSLEYINPIFYGAIFFVVVQMLNSILNAHGNTKPNRNFLIGGFVLNLLLDPWFIFGGAGIPAMGITGIALATVFVQFLGCLYLGFEVARDGLITRASLRQYLRPRPAIIRQIAQQGFPNIVDLSSVSIGFFILTFFVSRFGQDAVAAFGAAARIEQVALLPMIGLDVACLSLIAQNYGARLPERMNKTVATSLRYGMIIMAIGAGLTALFAPQLMRIFSQDPVVVNMGIVYIRIKALALPPSALFFIASATMRGLRRPVYALVLSMIRMVVLPAIALSLFILWLGFGLVSIWWLTLLITWLMGGVAFFYAGRLLKQAGAELGA